MRFTSGGDRYQHRRRGHVPRWGARLAIVTVSALGGAALLAAAALANVATATSSPPPTVSVTHNQDATVSVTLSGAWTWPSLKAPSTTRPCDGRFGVGWAMAWNDTADHGTRLTYVSGNKTIHVDVGSKGVNPTNTDSKVTYDHAHPCGTFTLTNSPSPGDGTVAGTYTGTHVYAGIADVPASICVVTYDLTGKVGTTGPDPARLLFTNEDNSVRDSVQNGGTWDPTPGGPHCVAVTATKATPTLSTTATGAAAGGSVFDSASLTGTVGGHGSGTITFNAYGPGDATCGATAVFSKQMTVSGDGSYGPVSFTPTQGAGDYRWVASYSGDDADNAVSGSCGDASETSVVSAPSTTPTTTPTTPTTTPPAPATAAAAVTTAAAPAQLAFTGPGPGMVTLWGAGVVFVVLGGALLVPGRPRAAWRVPSADDRSRRVN
jgi:hypothetical protein